MTDRIWGLWEYVDDVHCIPCNDEDIPADEHIVRPDCPCHPEVEMRPDGRTLYVHHELH